MRRPDSATDTWAQASAVLVAALMLLLLGRVLLRLPEAGLPPGREARMQLRLFSREPAPALPPPRLPDPAAPAPETAAPRYAPAAVEVIAAPVAAPAPARLSLIDDQGRVKLAPGNAEAPMDGDAAARVFEHRDPLQRGVGERATAHLFSGKAAGTTQSRTQRLLYGRDTQMAEARRPPEVAFNPALHERPSDLGSEATGDAYKAAPVRFEKAPGLAGDASRRIRARIGELDGRYRPCPPARRQNWMAPVLKHVDELQRLEYRYGHGADPVEAEHTLPRAADSAYDLARRALWYAERQLAACAG
ncbi:hypothetical protein [Stenotrophomonas sp. YIM B06876]|uniref:hypothetical protein n=1 Tax=Stenotrophomonas sp. YIM B06876 TaxID=3060211 RepID=UPI002738CF73|nr:hypothetical protein [Stenotrophomonas sp. YIM B06876]